MRWVDQMLSTSMKRTKLQCLKLMEKWGFGLSRKEVLETTGLYVNESKIHKPCRGGVSCDNFFICFKRTHKLSLKSHEALKHAEKKELFTQL